MKRLLFPVMLALFLAACSDSTNSPDTNRDPVITSDLVATPPEGEADLTVIFTLEADDPDGDPLTYNWDFDNDAEIDEETEEPRAQYTFPAGTYEVTLEVSDGQGGSAVTSVTVSARDPF